MNRKTLIFLSLLALFVLPVTAWAGCTDSGNCFLVRVPHGSQVAAVLQSHGLQHIDDVHSSRPEIFLAQGPAGVAPATTLQNLTADYLVAGAEIGRASCRERV